MSDWVNALRRNKHGIEPMIGAPNADAAGGTLSDDLVDPLQRSGERPTTERPSAFGSRLAEMRQEVKDRPGRPGGPSGPSGPPGGDPPDDGGPRDKPSAKHELPKPGGGGAPTPSGGPTPGGPGGAPGAGGPGGDAPNSPEGAAGGSRSAGAPGGGGAGAAGGESPNTPGGASGGARAGSGGPAGAGGGAPSSGPGGQPGGAQPGGGAPGGSGAAQHANTGVGGPAGGGASGVDPATSQGGPGLNTATGGAAGGGAAAGGAGADQQAGGAAGEQDKAGGASGEKDKAGGADGGEGGGGKAAAGSGDSSAKAEDGGGDAGGEADGGAARDTGGGLSAGGDGGSEGGGEGEIAANAEGVTEAAVEAAGGGGAGGGGGGGGGGGAAVEPSLGVPDLSYKAPMLSPDQAKQMLAETGKKPDAHAQRIQSRLGELRALAQGLQQQVVASARAQAASLGAQIQARVADVDGRAGAVDGAITMLFAGARGEVAASAQGARGTVEGGRKATLGQLQAEAKTAKTQVASKYKAQADTYARMKTSEMAPFDKVFGEYDGKARSVATDKSKKLKEQGAACDAYYDKGGNALDSFLGLVRAQYAKEKLPSAAADMEKGGGTRADQLKLDKGAIQQSLTATLDPLIARTNALAAQASRGLDSALGSATKKLNADADQALKAIDAAAATATGELDSKEAQAHEQVAGANERIQADVTAQGEAVEASIVSMSAGLADTWRAKVDGIRAAVPEDGPVTAEQLASFFDGQKSALEDLASAQRGQIIDAASRALGEASAGIDQGLGKFDPIQGEIDGDLSSWKSEKTSGLDAVAQGFNGALETLGSAIQTTLAQWLSPLETELKAQQGAVAKEMASRLGKTRTELQGKQASYVTELDQTVTKFPALQRDGADKNAEKAEGKVDDRAKQCFQAMRGMGTDEDKLFNAVRGMKVREPGATEYVFGKISGGESVTGWARKELNDEEHGIFENHWKLNHGAAARMEIKYNTPWWGTDQAQVETILRGLPDDERAKIKGDSEWASTRSVLQDKLGGRDLQVANALMENNVAKADAIQIKAKIDEARLKGDNDALHDALAGMDQEKVGDIAVEFAKLDGVTTAKASPLPTTNAEGKPLSDEEKKALEQQNAKKLMADYTVKDRDLGRGYKRKIEGANSDLARALIEKGSDSVDSKVARFQVELTRSGGANSEKLEGAVYVDADTQEGLHSPDPEVRKAAETKAAAQQKEFNDKYQAAYKKTPQEALKGSGESDKKKELYGLMLDKGYNSPEVAEKQIKEAIRGAGTDEDAIKRALKGMSPQEVTQLRAKYPKLDEDLGTDGGWGELSGADRQQVDLLLMGDPKHMNDDQRFELAKKKRDQQVGSEGGIAGNLVMGGSYEDKALDQNFKDLEAFRSTNASKFKNGKFSGTPEEYDEYKRMCKYVGVSAELYQEQTDRVANYATTAIAVVGAVAGTIVTGGLAGPMLAAAVTGVASMGANAALKGGRYGWENAATDLAVTGANVATAGIASKLNGANAGAGIFGNKVANAGSEFAKNAWSIGGKTAVAAGTGGLNSAANTALQDETWKNGVGKGFGEVMYSGGKGMLTSAVSTAAGESFAAIPGIKKLGDADSYIKKPFANAMKGSISNMSSKSTELFVDAQAGKFNGELDDALEQVGVEGLKGIGSGAFESFGEVNRTRREKQQLTHAVGADGANGGAGGGEGLQHKVEDQQVKTAQTEEQASEQLAQVDRQAADQIKPLNEQAKQSTTGDKVDPHAQGLNQEQVQTKVDQVEAEVSQQKEQIVKTVEKEKLAEQHVQQEAVDEQHRAVENESGADDQVKSNEVVESDGNDQQSKQTPQQHDTPEVQTKTAEVEAALASLTHEQRAALDALVQQGVSPEVALAKVTTAEDVQPSTKPKMSDDELLAELIRKEKIGQYTQEEIDHVLSGGNAEERQARLNEIHEKSQERIAGYDSYPEEIQKGLNSADPQEQTELSKKAVASFEKPGEEAALTALKALDGNPQAQLELAHHLAVLKSIMVKDFNQVASNPEEMLSLVKAHAALKKAQLEPDVMLRKFLSDGDAKNMLEMKAWDSNAKAMTQRDRSKVGGCVGDARNTDNMNAEVAAHVLGLDYTNSPFLENGGGTPSAKKESYFIDFTQTQEINDLAKVTFAEPIVNKIKEMAEKVPEAKFLLAHIKVRTPSGADDPNTGTGSTAAGSILGKGKHKTVNQEHHMGGSADLPDGTKMFKRKADGTQVVVAVYKVKPDGSGEWGPPEGQSTIEKP